jgi:group I intron endonuclease
MEIKIYKIENIKNNRIYIGQTLDFKTRFREHRNQCHENRHILNDSINYTIDDFKFDILCTCDNQNDADDREIYYISEYHSYKTEHGYNLTKGGKGLIIRETKIVYKVDLNFNVISKYDSIRESARENNMDASNIYRCCINKLNKYNGYYWCFCLEDINSKRNSENKCRKVEVAIFDLDGNIIETYESIKKASIKHSIKHLSCITNAIKFGNFYKGYFWRKYNGQELTHVKNPLVKRKINIFKDSILVNTFESQGEVAKFINGNPANINHCLKGRKKSYKGYNFEYH